MDPSEWETTDVLICGGGPTGAMLSGYLGRMGVSNVILEKESAITTDPRGIALDEDGIRLMQGLGLYGDVFTKVGTCIPRVRFVGGVHQDLQRSPIMSIDTGSSEGGTGHVGLIGHSQPSLEESLRTVIDASTSSQLRLSCTLTSIKEDDDWVYVTYLDHKNEVQRIRSRFLASADGKTGFTRKNYLEPKGIHLEWAEKTKYEETWVALNWKITLPTVETHLNFPLWKLGYTPEQVYDAFFPIEFRFLCNPRRPAVCGRFGLPEDRLWRFEFVIQPGEVGEEMAMPGKIQEVVMPYFKHQGSRYGLPGYIDYPEDCIEVLRCRPFKFSARSCDRWALGRVILCGDAAHVFPPFGGQGIASGFRDSVSLCWRLAIACRPSSTINHHRLLAGWYEERKQQLEKSLATTVRNGAMVNSRNPIQIFIRDWVLWLIQLIPSWRHRLEQGPRSAGVTRYTNPHGGLPFLSEFLGGVNFPQTYCVSMGEDSRVQFTDDVIFRTGKTKTKLFQLVVLLNTLDDLNAATHELLGIDKITDEISIEESTFFIPRTALRTRKIAADDLGGRVFRTAEGGEFAESDLCLNRPGPRGYDETLMWKEMKGRRFVILRPDRFVFAACRTRAELEIAVREISRFVSRGSLDGDA